MCNMTSDGNGAIIVKITFGADCDDLWGILWFHIELGRAHGWRDQVHWLAGSMPCYIATRNLRFGFVSCF